MKIVKRGRGNLVETVNLYELWSVLKPAGAMVDRYVNFTRIFDIAYVSGADALMNLAMDLAERWRKAMIKIDRLNVLKFGKASPEFEEAAQIEVRPGDANLCLAFAAFIAGKRE